MYGLKLYGGWGIIWRSGRIEKKKYDPEIHVDFKMEIPSGGAK